MQRDRFQIQPDTRIEIDEPGAIELLCRPFAKHDKGLPEWVKNAAGAYDRFGAVLTELDAAAFRELLSRIATSCPLDWEDEESCPFGKDEDACWEEQRRGGFDYRDCYRALYRALAAKAHQQEED